MNTKQPLFNIFAIAHKQCRAAQARGDNRPYRELFKFACSSVAKQAHQKEAVIRADFQKQATFARAWAIEEASEGRGVRPANPRYRSIKEIEAEQTADAKKLQVWAKLLELAKSQGLRIAQSPWDDRLYVNWIDAGRWAGNCTSKMWISPAGELVIRRGRGTMSPTSRAWFAAVERAF